MTNDCKVPAIATCCNCGTTKVYMLPLRNTIAWRGGMLIQEAFPDLPAEDREFLISGLCPECWNKLFSSTDED